MAIKRRRYSIAEARQNLAALVHEVERGSPVEVSRRGEPVAILVPLGDYERLTAGRSTFWEAVLEFRRTADLKGVSVGGEFLRGVRDPSRGREPPW